MKKQNLLTSLFLSGIIILSACGPAEKAKDYDTGTEEVEEKLPELTLTKAPVSPEFADASLTMAPVEITYDSTYKANFNFTVENYELGVQTETAETRGIANSGKGQHIHLIIDNGPYSAHYEPTFTKEMEEGSYVVLAFLSRSYHESVKNANSFAIDVVTVGEAEPLEVDFEAPHMFYSRPKGTYVGDDTKKLMIDFFLLNTTLSPDGNKVRATVNGQEFMIDEWAPYYIEGLQMGEVTVKLELIDNEGTVIPGPFNSVTRTVILEEAEENM